MVCNRKKIAKSTLFAIATIFSVFSLLLASLCISAPYSYAATLNSNSATINSGGDTLKSGLVGHWTFDGADLVNNVTDKSGNGNTGNMINMATSTAKVAGKLGQALRFDGVDDRILVPSVSASSISTSFWFKLDTTYNNLTTTAITIFSDYSNANLNSNISLVGTETTNGSYTKGSLVFKTESSALSYLSTANTTWNANQWYHIVAILDSGSSMSIYVNGVLSSTISTTNSWSSFSATPKYIGGGTANWQGNVDLVRYMLGILDDVRIYSRVLTASEIKQLYNLGAAKINTSSVNGNSGGDTLRNGLVGHWTFDGADLVNNVTDKSGNGNTGNMMNMSTSTAKVAGKLGQALQFDGVNDYVRVPSTTGGGTTNTATFSAWVYPITKNAYDGVIFYRNTGTPRGLLLNGNGTDITYCWECTTDEYNANTGLTLTNRKWYFVTVVITPTAATVYKIDEQGQVSSWTNTKTHNAYSLNVAYDIGLDNAGRYWNGNIDDIRLYSRSLSLAEIKQLYNLGAAKINTSSVNGNSGGDTLRNGLVGHWTFDGADLVNNVADKSGNGNTGNMISMATSTAKVPGKLGQALNFDGVNDYVATTNTMSAAGNSRTACFWFRTSISPAIRQEIIGTRGGNSGWAINIGQGNAANTLTYYHAGVATFSVSTTLSAGVWYHVCASYNASTQIAQLYKNGAYLNQASFANDAASLINGKIGVGACSMGDCYLSGSVDDVRIYHRVLTASEIKRLYNLSR